MQVPRKFNGLYVMKDLLQMYLKI
uniref:Uncharacterized protein n=1 Tax=Arundo donax TaxID=35708 RepID=A0A0A9BR46_ARUDO